MNMSISNHKTRFKFLITLLVCGLSLVCTACSYAESSEQPETTLSLDEVSCGVVTEVWPDFWNAAVSFWNWSVVLDEYKQTGKVTDLDTPAYLADDLRDDWSDVQDALDRNPAGASGLMKEIVDMMNQYIRDEYLFIDNMETTLENFKQVKQEIEVYCE
jgi:hypothetical protein